MYRYHFVYEDYNGVKREEDHYFDLSEPEIMRLNYSSAGGLAEAVERISQEQDGGRIIELFERIIQMSYGEKSEDGKLFVKSEEAKQRFIYSPMYPMLYMKLGTDAEFAAEFINAIVPKKADQKESNLKLTTTNAN